jgi:hypothetical protein
MALPNARRTPRIRSRVTENAHPVKRSLALNSVPLLRVGNGGEAEFPSLTGLNSLSAMTIASGSAGKRTHIDLVERVRPNCES